MEKYRVTSYTTKGHTVYELEQYQHCTNDWCVIGSPMDSLELAKALKLNKELREQLQDGLIKR
jgi:hypothetical protein